MTHAFFRSGFDWRKIIALGLIVVALIEILLLEIKYQILSGEGFLQSAPLVGGLDKSMFLFFYCQRSLDRR